MTRHIDQFLTLRPEAHPYDIEGRIWTPNSVELAWESDAASASTRSRAPARASALSDLDAVDAEADSPVPEGWLVPPAPQLLEPQDRFSGIDATVVDFWRWAHSDLRDNTIRGVLAEFLVAAALGRTETRRKGWDNFDVLTSSGIRVEVKASGYLQSWAQATPSKLSFGRVAARAWDENTNRLGDEPEVRADVFVFAVQTCRDHAAYDVLDTGQWEFYVVDADEVRECGYKSVTISWVSQRAHAVGIGELAAAIEACAQGQSD